VKRSGSKKTKPKVESNKAKAKAKKSVSDPQVEEFEARDLGEDVRMSGTARVLRKRSMPTSIVLEEDLIKKLREKATSRGLGYQTMLKVIVREHLDEY
jgi:predicted DNA binding CopG/RHH family protein